MKIQPGSFPTDQNQGLIQMQDIVKTYHTTAGDFTALRGVDLSLEQGEFAALIGKSGSGKSTLLNMLTGIDHPTGGQVLVDGKDIYSLTESQRSLWRGRNLGIVFQFFQLLPMLNLMENVMLPMDYVGMYEIDQRPKKALELLELVGLKDQAQHLPRAVSRGQQQSAAIARALATDAPILVADEPTGNLDSRSAGKIIDLFEELSRRGKTILMVTHDPSMTKRASRTIFISDGELVNETIAQSLPLLTHPLMMELSHRVQPLYYQPGATILEQRNRVENFYMIQKGQVEIVLQGRFRDDLVITSLKKNDFFGEISLLKGGKAIASVRASNQGPVELLALPREDFQWLMDQSPLTEEAICRIVQQRLDENQNITRTKKKGLFGRG
ncbi:MAG: ATP-binding cassette domain-containing protein [Anaerolineales bacterium]|nr:ATP-binding cassette domain-containing protein [Anaerolineales bacterium]